MSKENVTVTQAVEIVSFGFGRNYNETIKLLSRKEGTWKERPGCKIERLIVERLVDEILAKGWSVSVYFDGDWNCQNLRSKDAILAHLGNDCYETISVHGLRQNFPNDPVLGHINLVWGNNEDIISDYTVNDQIEQIVNDINTWIEN